MLINQLELQQSDLKQWSNDDLIYLINTLRHRLEKKETSFQRLKKDLEASRTYNGKLQDKVRYLQARIVDSYREHDGKIIKV